MQLFVLFDLENIQSDYKGAVEHCLLKQDDNEAFNPMERYYNFKSQLKGSAEVLFKVSENLTFEQVYIASDISSLLYLEFMKMIQYNIFVRKCENCGRLFVLKGNYNTKYCNRIAPNSNKTCQEVGAINSFKKKALNDPVIGEYQKAYNRLYARKRTGKISEYELNELIKKAILLRDRAVNKDIELNDYLEQITKI